MLKQRNLKGRATARKQIAIKEVRDDILVMPHGFYASVIQTSSVNFELKSEEEQDVLLDKYSQFLNSLPQNIQILVRIRELDIHNYLSSISSNNDEYLDQVEDYKKFVSGLVSGNKIMTRRFYIVIPLHSSSKDFSTIKEQLNLHTDIVIKQLELLQMKAHRVNGIDLLNLFFELYNPHKNTSDNIHVLAKEKILGNNYAI